MPTPRLTYEPNPEWSPAAVERAVAEDKPDALAQAVIAVAMSSGDRSYAEALCTQLSAHPHSNVRGNAILGFGHIARVYGTLNRKVVQAIIAAGLHDENEYVRSQAHAAKGDTEHFLRWTYRDPKHTGKATPRAGPRRPPAEAGPKRHTFTARIGKVGILRCVVVPPAIVAALGGGLRIPVIARYAGEITRSTLSPAGGKRRRLVLRMEVLRPARLDAGTILKVSLEPSTESHKQTLPPDLARALQFRPTAAIELDRASPSTWRMILARLEEARAPETRQRRVEQIVERLAEMAASRAKKA